MKLNGRLLYMGWINIPWRLVTDGGEIDLHPVVEKFFVSLNGQRANHKREIDGYTLSADGSSEFKLEYVPNKHILLAEVDDLGFSNICAYLDEALVWLSGRLVEINIENGKQIKFTADKSEDVYGVYFVGDGNSCEVPNGAEQAVCKVGRRECCIFLTAGSNGFQCEKFNRPIARMLLDRLAKDTIRASRIGNCALIGRKEREIAA